MSIKENNLVTIAAADLSLTDKIRCLDSKASRNITVADLITIFEDNTDVTNALTLAGGTLTGDLAIVKEDPTLSLTTSTGSTKLALQASSAETVTIEMGDITDPDAGQIEYDNNTNALTLSADGAVGLTLDASQNLTIVGDLAITGGNITTATTMDSTLTVTGAVVNNSTTDLNGALTCKAITVDASSALDMGANKLTNVADPTSAQDVVTKQFLENDFYEQGTWTPVLSDGTFTATATVLGYYERVGDLITYRGSITVTSLGSMTGIVRITGLPYNAIAVELGDLVVGTAENLNVTAGEIIVGTNVASSNYIQLGLWDATTGTTDLLSTEVTATTILRFSGAYRAV